MSISWLDALMDTYTYRIFYPFLPSSQSLEIFCHVNPDYLSFCEFVDFLKSFLSMLVAKNLVG